MTKSMPGTRPIDALLLVDKPAGITSHDVVSVARRALGEKRIGHAGTLDPFATGLLVLLTGRATRVLPYVEGEPKEYAATITWGAETDTDDATGAITREAPPPSLEAISAGIASLTGRIEQVPPDYSAKQVDGRRAHAAARRGAPLALAPVTVQVHSWRVREHRDTKTDVTIVCGAGTYIRALARDLGRATGSAAHLSALRRTRSGPFDVASAATFADLRDGRATLRSPREAIPSLAEQRMSVEDAARLARGMRVGASVEGERAALIDDSGTLLAIAERSDGQWQPRVVLAHE
ncbi:MAG TPA: tRNA pseudouridine(55) synthase TruB [Gemmatimonadaceae bacterium]|nr:tRNA pseudouridine(55) synthase TruB [Gemmatimonadaceae bacterium]